MNKYQIMYYGKVISESNDLKTLKDLFNIMLKEGFLRSALMLMEEDKLFQLGGVKNE